MPLQATLVDMHAFATFTSSRLHVAML